MNNVDDSNSVRPTVYYVHPDHSKPVGNQGTVRTAFQVIPFNERAPELDQHDGLPPHGKQPPQLVTVKQPERHRLMVRIHQVCQLAMTTVGVIGLPILLYRFVCTYDPVHFVLALHFLFASEIGLLGYISIPYQSSWSSLAMAMVNALFLPLACAVEVFTYKVPIVAVLCLVQSILYSRKFVIKY